MRIRAWPVLALAFCAGSAVVEPVAAQRRGEQRAERQQIAVAEAGPRHFPLVMSSLANIDDYLRTAERLDFERSRVVLIDVREAVPEGQGRLQAYRERLRQRATDIVRLRRFVSERPTLRNALRYTEVDVDEVVALRLNGSRDVIIFYDRSL
jgi:hypothetical protein